MTIRKVLHCLPMLMMVLTFCTPAIAQESKTNEKQESAAAGSWKWKRASLSGEVTCQIHLTEKDGKISGTYSDEEEIKGEVGEVKIEDDQVSMTIVLKDDGKKSEVKLSGKLDGDKIVGKMIDGSSEQDWKAKRFISLQQVEGKWRLSFTTPDGQERNPEFELKAEDGKPTLDFSLGDGEEEDEAGNPELKKIKFSDGLLVFDMKLEFQGQELTLEYELEFISSDELEGSMYFEFEGADMSGDVDVTGERTK